MAYKFTGRIKKIGIKSIFHIECPIKNVRMEIEKNKVAKSSLYNRYCEFDVDNSIMIEEKEYGVAYQGKELDIVEEFMNIEDNIFSLFQSCKDERFEIYYDYYIIDDNGEEKLAKTKREKDSFSKITKVTVL